jgi:hypothetical protein
MAGVVRLPRKPHRRLARAGVNSKHQRSEEQAALVGAQRPPGQRVLRGSRGGGGPRAARRWPPSRRTTRPPAPQGTEPRQLEMRSTLAGADGATMTAYAQELVPGAAAGSEARPPRTKTAEVWARLDAGAGGAAGAWHGGGSRNDNAPL